MANTTPCHPSSHTVSVAGQASLCEACYQKQLPDLEKQRLEAVPLQDDLECLLGGPRCTGSPCRLSKDLGVGICDTCRKASHELEQEASKNLVLHPTPPDELDVGHVFIGPKQSAVDATILKERNIHQVLICCTHLPLYLPNSGDIAYHRLAIADSLEQDILEYLPAALAFIQRGVEAGHATLIHCNAGVSRSGSIAVAWLMKTQGLDYDSALKLAKEKRKNICPNSHFATQLRDWKPQTDLIN